jgi:hypothetical protein
MSNKIQLFIKKVKGIVKLADLNPYQRGKIITALNRNKEQLKLKQAQRTKKQVPQSAPVKKRTATKTNFEAEIMAHIKQTFLNSTK